MKNEHWIGWFRLSTKSDTRSSWFHKTLTTDPDEFDKCCQLIMRKIFTMFESACHNLTSSPERAYLDFLLGEDFKQLYEKELPECLRDNRHCAIYLVDSLKTIFEAWFADAVIDLKKQNLQLEGKASDEDQIVDVSSDECIMMTQNVVGSIFSKMRSNKNFVSEGAQKLIERMRFRLFKEKASETYLEKYYPPLLRHTNRGGHSLIREPFFPVTQELMKICVEAASERHRYKQQQHWISNGLTSVRTDQALLSQFKEVVLTELGSDYCKRYSKLIKATWQRIVEGSMRGLAKYINNKDFGNKKVNSTNHVTFRNQVDCGAKTADSDKPKKKAANEKKRSFPTMLRELTPAANDIATSQSDNAVTSASTSTSNPTGPASLATGGSNEIAAPPSDNVLIGASASSSNTTDPAPSTAEGAVRETTPDAECQPPPAKKKRTRNRRRSKEEIKAGWVSVHGDALSQLDKKGNVGGVKKEYICSILWVSFGKYCPQSTTSLSDLKKELTDAIAKDPDWRQRNGPVAPPLPTGTATT